jgi:hypothetical protein
LAPDPGRRVSRMVPRWGTAFGSPFFCLLFFGEAKKSKSAFKAETGLRKC